MLVIRLIRTGKKNAPSFRIVVIEKTAPPKSGKFLEILGNYNPRMPAKDGSVSVKELNLKKERIEYWLSQGVQTSAAVHNLLVNQGIIKGPKIKKKIRIKKKKEMKKKAKETKAEKGEIKEETKVKKEVLAKGGSASGGKEEKRTPELDKSEEKSKMEKE